MRAGRVSHCYHVLQVVVDEHLPPQLEVVDNGRGIRLQQVVNHQNGHFRAQCLGEGNQVLEMGVVSEPVDVAPTVVEHDDRVCGEPVGLLVEPLGVGVTRLVVLCIVVKLEFGVLGLFGFELALDRPVRGEHLCVLVVQVGNEGVQEAYLEFGKVGVGGKVWGRETSGDAFWQVDQTSQQRPCESSVWNEWVVHASRGWLVRGQRGLCCSPDVKCVSFSIYNFGHEKYAKNNALTAEMDEQRTVSSTLGVFGVRTASFAAYRQDQEI